MKNVMNMLKKEDQRQVIDDMEDDDFFQDDDFEEDEDEDDLDDEFEDENDEDVFTEFTDKVQSLLDDGAIALEIAEEKTAQLEGMNSSSDAYEQLVEEIKVAQEQARTYFEDAEYLIKKANEILEENK